MRRTGIGVIVVAVAVVWCASASATITSEYTFTGLDASAHFWVDGNKLYLQLTNTRSPAESQADLLGALLFSYSGPTLAPLGALAPSGSGLYDYSTSTGTWSSSGASVGQGWAFSGVSSPPAAGLNYGVGALDYGWLDQTKATFVNPGVASVDGPNFALLNALAGSAYSFPTAIENNSPFVINETTDPASGASAIFTWTFTGDLNVPRDIGGVWFQFGTGKAGTPEQEDNGQYVPVPEPASMVLLALGLGMTAVGIRKRLRKR